MVHGRLLSTFFYFAYRVTRGLVHLKMKTCTIHMTFILSSRKQGDVLRNANDALFHTMKMNEDRGCQAPKNALVFLLSSYCMNFRRPLQGGWILWCFNCLHHHSKVWS